MKIKQYFFLFFFLLQFSIQSFSQNDNIALYTAGAKFLLAKTTIDPTIIEIVERTLPSALNKDANGAITAFANVIYEKKKIKELNPEFLKYSTNKINQLVVLFPKKDYLEITMSISDLILVTDNYLNKNILPDNTTPSTNKTAKSIVDTSKINKSVDVIQIDHQSIIEQLKQINSQNKTIRCIAFTSFGGYVILYGKNGYFAKGIPKNPLSIHSLQ